MFYIIYLSVCFIILECTTKIDGKNKKNADQNV